MIRAQRAIQRDDWPLGIPAVGAADFEHFSQNGVPCVHGFKGRVREHTAVPTNVSDAALRRSLQPVAGAFRDIQLAVRIIRGTVASRLVVGAGSVDGSVVLRNVEIKGPRPQGVRHLLIGSLEFRMRVLEHFTQQQLSS